MNECQEKSVGSKVGLDFRYIKDVRWIAGRAWGINLSSILSCPVVAMPMGEPTNHLLSPYDRTLRTDVKHLSQRWTRKICQEMSLWNVMNQYYPFCSFCWSESWTSFWMRCQIQNPAKFASLSIPVFIEWIRLSWSNTLNLCKAQLLEPVRKLSCIASCNSCIGTHYSHYQYLIQNSRRISCKSHW